MKKRMKAVAVLLTFVMAIGMTGCGSKEKAASKGKTDSINVLMWEGDCSEEVFEKYEEETGIHVNVTYIEDTNIILQKMLLGEDEYDVVDLESAYVKSFVDAKLIEPLDYERITNAKYIDPTYNAKGTGPKGDENFDYVVPLSGPLYTCVIYNKETCPVTINTFSDLADPKLKGEICSVNATVSLYAGALKTLGYPIGSTDDQQMAEAHQLLTKIKQNVKAFVGASALSQLEAGECSVAYCWDYNLLCNDSEDNWDKFEIVDDTCLGYNQFWAVSANSEKKDAAMDLINYTFEPENVELTLEEYGGVPVLADEYIKDLLPEGYYDAPYIKRYKELWADHESLSVSDEQNDLMDKYYNELMAGVTSE